MVLGICELRVELFWTPQSSILSLILLFSGDTFLFPSTNDYKYIYICICIYILYTFDFMAYFFHRMCASHWQLKTSVTWASQSLPTLGSIYTVLLEAFPQYPPSNLSLNITYSQAFVTDSATWTSYYHLMVLTAHQTFHL